MVGILVVGFVANLLIRPVAERYHERTREATGRFKEKPEPQRAYETEEAAR